MGAAVAAQLQRHEITVLWHPAGRSDATTHRATAAGLTATTDLTELLERAHIVLSIYPPAAAEDIATTVATQAYQGIYVDANAISPSRMRHIATTLTATGTTVIDAATISPPPINQRGRHTDLPRQRSHRHHRIPSSRILRRVCTRLPTSCRDYLYRSTPSGPLLR
ncbi:NAD(P)-binding domain-containing protein [Salinispora arenicola]|uniref:NAD(P)-binding domain-containing protein n=1 Tax=Salinispora arenicola TaxID=168697 RepID=UPI0003A8FB26|nr:NAD(P)-binding domain-containing protein [Salinispora arenicola]